jgi:hypothetical protein
MEYRDNFQPACREVTDTVMAQIGIQDNFIRLAVLKTFSLSLSATDKDLVQGLFSSRLCF